MGVSPKLNFSVLFFSFLDRPFSKVNFRSSLLNLFDLDSGGVTQVAVNRRILAVHGAF